MDDVIIDSSVAIKWFVTEPLSSEAHSLLDGYQKGTLNFVAPDLLFAEIGNIVWKKHRFQGLPAAAAQLIIDAFRALKFCVISGAILLEEAFRLATNHQRTVYDSMYLALSIRENCKLVTADEKMVNSLSPSYPNIIWLRNWP